MNSILGETSPDDAYRPGVSRSPGVLPAVVGRDAATPGVCNSPASVAVDRRSDTARAAIGEQLFFIVTFLKGQRIQNANSLGFD